MKKLLLVVAALALAACSSETMAPARKVPAASSKDLTCRTGYVIAFDENGNEYCAPDGRMVVRKP